jgi:DNA-binding response OmpR family regulator
MRILVVEDDRKVAGFIRKGLEEEGHAVEVAGDGAAAIERATDGAPWDLVVLDVWPPCR